MFQFYLALTFWLMIGLLEAYAIFRLAEGIVRPRWIHMVLLPGTVVAETAHFVAALLTGAPVHEARLVSDESIIDPGKPAEARKGIPILSPLLIALLPILAAMVIIYLLYRRFEGGVVDNFAWSLHLEGGRLAQSLSWQLGAWFDIGRNMLTLCERLLGALPFERLSESWRGWLFIYLTACLAIRMVPLRNSLRNGMAVVVLVGGLLLLCGLIDAVDRGVHNAWPLIAYAVALLTTLLGAVLVVRGVIALGFVLADKPVPTRNG